MEYIELRNQVQVPAVGYGTYKVSNDLVTDLVVEALKIGYRHIDTATFYQNESGIGQAIKASGVPRSELFITSKVWMDDLGYDKTKRAFEQSLQQLGLDYLDMYLIHWPRKGHLESWRAIEELYEQGKVRAIGVSNYSQQFLEELLAIAKYRPMVNQIELHPRLTQPALCRYCQEKEIRIEAWAPLMRGQIVTEPLLESLAKQYQKSAAAIVLRWHLQRGRIIFPKTLNFERLRQNFELFDFSLSPTDCDRIDALNQDDRTGFTPEYMYQHGYTRGK